MTLTPEQLAALKEVAEKTQDAFPNVNWFTISDLRRSKVALGTTCSEFIATFDPTTCLELLEEVERLRGLLEKGRPG
jgi:hypothetical protein